MIDKLKIITAMFIFGTISIFVKNIGLSSAEIALWRAVLAMIVLGSAMALSGKFKNIKSDKKTFIKLFISGAIMGFNWILLFESYKYTSVAVATLCYYFEPVLVVVASYFLFKESLTPKKIVCFAMATAGLVAIVISGGLGSNNGMMGIVMALSAAVFYATVVLINKSIREIDSIERTFFQFVSAVIVVLPYVLATDGIHLGEITLFGGVNLLILGFVHTGMAYLMYFSSVSNISGQQASLFGYIDPVTAIVISAVVLQEVISPMQWIGGATVLIFTLINEIEFKKKA